MTDETLQSTAAQAAAADAVSARDLLKSDPDFVARATSNIPWIRDRAQQQWDSANAEAAKAEVAASKAADDAQRDGSAETGTISYDLPSSALLSGQEADPDLVTFGQEAARALQLNGDEWQAVTTAWSAAVASLDRGASIAEPVDVARELVRRTGSIEAADAELAAARAFLKRLPSAQYEPALEKIGSAGLDRNAVFVMRLAAMERARGGRR